MSRALTGFVFLPPLMPMEFTGMVHLALGTQFLTPGNLGILIVLILLLLPADHSVLISARGSLQELASDVPLKKIDISRTRILEMIRVRVFIVTNATGLYFINLKEYTGIYDFFSFGLTPVSSSLPPSLNYRS